jgi:hypothetical protein
VFAPVSVWLWRDWWRCGRLTGAMKLGHAWWVRCEVAEAHDGGGCIVAVGDATMVVVMVLSLLSADFPTSSFAALEGT